MPDRRIRLFREGVRGNDGRALSGVVWTDEPLPAMYLGEIIGTVDQVRREDEGWVTGVVHTDRDLVGLASEVSVDQAKMVKEGTMEVIVGARLRAVALGKSPVWGGMVIKPEPPASFDPPSEETLDQAIEASLMDWYHPTARAHRKRLAAELQRVRELPRDEISAVIKNAYYSARDNGGTMHTAGDVAADSVLALIRGET